MFRKGKYLLLILLAAFFLQIKDAKAFVGTYVYDVNSVYVSGNNLYISGWGVTSIDSTTGRYYGSTWVQNVYHENGPWETHNISPQYTIYIVAGGEQYNYYNVAGGNGDYSLPYKDGDVYCGSSRCNVNGGVPDYHYINDNFTIKIPLSGSADSIQSIRDRLPVGNNKVLFLLNITLSGVSPAGGSGSTMEQLYLQVQKDRASNSGLFEVDPLVGFSNPVSKVKLVATNASVRCIGGAGWTGGLLANRVSKGGACGDIDKGSSVLFNGGNAGEVYDVHGQASVDVGGISYWYYKVCVDANGHNTACPGVRNDTFIPSFWAIAPPTTDNTLTIIKPSPCAATHTIVDESLSDNTDTQNLSCSSATNTTATFDRPNKTVIKYADGYKDGNGNYRDDGRIYCQLVCSEKLDTTFQPTPKVDAGTGFKYPVMFSGQRTCNFSYNLALLNADLATAKDWDEKARRIEDPDTVQGAINGNGTIIYKDESDPKYCSFWKTRYQQLQDISGKCESIKISDWEKGGPNQYDIDADVNATASTSEIAADTIRYKKDSSIINDTSATGDKYNWSLTSTVNATYSFSQAYYIEKYTGKKVTTPNESVNYTTDEDNQIAQYKYFTELNEYTNDYNLDLALTNVGRNVGSFWTKKWNIDLDCSYHVDNKIFPRPADTNYPKYGGVAFAFRQITLTNPFPGRPPRSNWVGHVADITTTPSAIYNNGHIQYFVQLQKENMMSIRNSNNGTSYSTYDMIGTTEHSKFVCDDYAFLFPLNQCNE